MEDFANTKKLDAKLTDKLVPLGLDLDVVGQAALHDVEAVVVAGLDVGVALASGTGVHLLDGREAGFAR